MLTDFGISKIIEEATGCAHSQSSSSFNGSIRWMAFEVIRGYGADKDGLLTDSIQISTSTDIWAFGSTVLEVNFSRLKGL